jgi:hypothetical protein
MKYRELHPTKEGNRKWRYITTGVVKLRLLGDGAGHRDCKMFVNGKIVAEIKKGSLYVSKGYAWNGCSPKRYIGWPPVGMWVGTPDFKESLAASLGHDVLFQFSALLEYNMNQVNTFFYYWMEIDGMDSALQDIYHGAVKSFGGRFWGKKDPSLSVVYV